jgi:hypothetical protein
MLNSSRNRLTFAAMLFSLAGLAGTASAETTWQKNHRKRPPKSPLSTTGLVERYA